MMTCCNSLCFERRWQPTLLAALLLIGVVSTSHAAALPSVKPAVDPSTGEPYEFTLERAAAQKIEADELICHLALGTPHNFAFGAALASLDPVQGNAYGLTAWSLNLALKACIPALDAPRDIEALPAAGACSAKISRPATSGNAKNILGAQLAVSGDWGAGGKPRVFSFNTDVEVTSEILNLELPAEDSQGLRTFPVGLYDELFYAENLASGWDFVYVPAFNFPKGLERFLGGPGGREAAEVVFGIAVEAGLFAGDFTDFLFPSIKTGNARGKSREIAVLDVQPPVATVTQSQFEIEALELGGASVRGVSPNGGTNRELLRTGFTVTDNCDQFIELDDPQPPFWPIGEETTIVWKARDDGPNQARGPNTTNIVQTVSVVDTLPPEILAPPDRVVETAGGTATVTLEPPRVFDFGDPSPDIALDGGAPPESLDLPLGINQLSWSATDDFGHKATATQTINVKAEGTNQSPVAIPGSAQAVTFEPVKITIQGGDVDFDPLSFRIVDFPPNGGFEAPLLPYFIKDFRGDFESASTCDPDREMGVLADPVQVKITDEGLTYILDCDGTGNDRRSRVTVQTADRELLAGRVMPNNASVSNGVYLSPATGEILYAGQNFTQDPQFFRLDPLTLETIEEYRPQSLAQVSSPNAFMIDSNDLMFIVTGAGEVDVFDLLEAIDRGDYLELPDRLSRIKVDPLETAGGGFQAIRDIAITGQGEILFLGAGRIHRMLPSTRRSDGTPVIGEFVGWLGACGSGEGCDLSREASRGYSCITGVTCNTGNEVLRGPNDGQLNEAFSLGVDKRNNVYVADFGNARVQRFTDDGVFGGQARSECPGDQRCFVLGDFGNPSVISVNSRNLYVLDKATDVVHIFETSVIEPIDDISARVVYTANDGFQGTDTFTFRATDGLDESAPASVSVSVTRNFRPPVADNLEVIGDEDAPTAIRLSATDPDGALDTPLQYEVLSHPDQGTLSGTPPVLIYTPPRDWYGSTSMTFRAFDGLEYSDVGTVDIEIEPVNDAPTISFEGVDADDPATPVIEVTAGYPANFKFTFDDVDDVDLHRFDVDWSSTSPGLYLETDVVSPDEDNASPLLVQMPGGGEVAASFTFTNPNEVATVRACVSDNVVIENDFKLNTSTTLVDCVDVQLVQTPRPELDVVISAPSVIVGQESTAIVNFTVSNRAPDFVPGVEAPSPVVTVKLPPTAVQIAGPSPATTAGIEGCIGSDVCASYTLPTLQPGQSSQIQYEVDVEGYSEGTELPLSIDARVIAEVTSPTRTTAVMTVGPPADIVVTASEGEASQCRFECSRSSFSCPGAVAQPICSLSHALELAKAAPQDAGNPVIVLGNGTFSIDEASAPYRLDTSLTIAGLGPEKSVISGARDYPLIHSAAIAARLSNLALSGGKSEEDPVINIANGTRLTLDGVVVSDNEADVILHNAGDLVLNQVALVDNVIENYLIEVLNPTTLENVIIMDNNHAQARDLGLIGNLAGVVQMNHVTAVNNDSPVLYSLPGAGFMEIRNSVFADTAEPACRTDLVTAQTSSGGNIYRPGNGCPISPQDLETSAAVLSPRDQRDGMPIALPLVNGPATDFIQGTCAAVDLLSTERPEDGNDDGISRCDSGALELPRAIFADGFE